MIDYFALALTHGLLALACWRIVLRGELDAETAEAVQPAPDAPPKDQHRA